MKKLFTLLCLLLFTISVSAQLVGKDELQKMKEQIYGNRTWKQIATLIRADSELDENKALKYVKVVQIPGESKNQIFDNISLWITDNFGGSDCDIRLINKEQGMIIAQGSVRDVVDDTGGLSHSYKISLVPVLKIECKDEKARITVSASTYNVQRSTSTGGFFSKDIYNDEVWNIATCFPFDESNDFHTRTSAAAFVMTHLCANVYVTRTEKALLTKQNKSSSNNDW